MSLAFKIFLVLNSLKRGVLGLLIILEKYYLVFKEQIESKPLKTKQSFNNRV